MSSIPANDTNPDKPAGKITFSSYNLPVLDDGLYKITVSHDFQADSSSAAAAIPSQTKYFAALGPRYSLEPNEIGLQFPPPGTSGDYYNVLPHILFNRAILPWERRLDETKPQTPWLALVMLTDDEISGWQKTCGDTQLLTVRTGPLATVCGDAQTQDIIFPALLHITLLPGESPQELVNYIDIPEALLQLVLPKEDELPLLANVRRSADTPAAGSENPKFPVLMCNRLPQAGQENTVLLISLENRLDVYAGLSAAAPITGEPSATAATKKYRFAVLQHWRFASVTPKLTFEQLLLDANRHATSTTGAYRLPEVGDALADPFLSKGYVPLEHQTRQGNAMVSWYRGPLLPGFAGTAEIAPPSSISSPDQLVRVHAELGMFDVSYACAFQIGRSIVLENKRVSQALFEWKRACSQAAKASVPAHLPCKKAQAPALPPLVKDWFARLGRLEQVPFNYLVPDPRLLPEGSIQFFALDAAWIELLLRGAFAVGDIASCDEAIEDSLFSQIPLAVAMTGFMLHSPVVSGWPHLLVDGFASEPPVGTNPPFETGAATLVQYRYVLGKDTLLCLFEGAVKSVEIYLHPESIHYGVDYRATDPAGGVPSPCYLKYLRDKNGNPVQPANSPCGTDRSSDFMANQWVRMPFRFPDCGVLDVDTLLGRFNSALSTSTMTPAQFAYQMVAGVPKVRFTNA